MRANETEAETIERLASMRKRAASVHCNEAEAETIEKPGKCERESS